MQQLSLLVQGDVVDQLLEQVDVVSFKSKSKWDSLLMVCVIQRSLMTKQYVSQLQLCLLLLCNFEVPESLVFIPRLL